MVVSPHQRKFEIANSVSHMPNNLCQALCPLMSCGPFNGGFTSSIKVSNYQTWFLPTQFHTVSNLWHPPYPFISDVMLGVAWTAKMLTTTRTQRRRHGYLWVQPYCKLQKWVPPFVSSFRIPFLMAISIFSRRPSIMTILVSCHGQYWTRGPFGWSGKLTQEYIRCLDSWMMYNVWPIKKRSLNLQLDLEPPNNWKILQTAFWAWHSKTTWTGSWIFKAT